MLSDVVKDIRAVDAHWLMVILSNRGFHALLIYRLANWLWLHKIYVAPLIITRLIHILYGIDIDYRARIDGGVVIVHGVGLVIGQGVVIKGGGQKLYHGVTLGISNSEHHDGFPELGANVLVGAGAKILGPVTIGSGAKIGANAVVLADVPDQYIAVGVPAKILRPKQA